jgi:bacterioferritin (cytochrome b1)
MENKNELLNKLTSAFNIECNDLFIYNKEADLINKKIKNGKNLAVKFNELAKCELRHADRIAMEIIRLGGKPEWECRLPKPETSIRSIIKKHLENEAKMYIFYEDLINMTEDIDFKLTLKGIRADEKDHIDLMADLLKDLERN